MDNNYFMPRGGYAPSYLATTNANANTNIIWTMGIESAKAYPLYPGRTILLMDSESPRFFIKTMDTLHCAPLHSKKKPFLLLLMRQITSHKSS